MSKIPNDDLIQKLADEVSRLVRDWLTPRELTHVLDNNSSSPPGLCAIRMAEAFAIVTGRNPDFRSEADMALWSVAWLRARNAQFPRRLTLTANKQGAPVQAFRIKDAYIYDPQRSECGAVAVDPTEHYGLRAEEVVALETANAESTDSNTRADCSAGEAVKNSEPRVTSVTALCQLYPNLQVWHTGGGCFALRHDCDDGGYLLITDSDGAQLPEKDATEVYAGRYAANGDIVLDAMIISITKVEAWIDAQLASAAEPKTISDYFVKKLGAGHDDESLRELPVDSACGQDCVAAIDAAAALLGHVRSACGNDDDRSSRAVVDITRRVVGIYWHG